MTPVLSVQDLHLRRGSRDVLRGVTFDVATGESVAIMGLSGAGKTTVLRVVAGLEPGAGASVRLTTGPDEAGRGIETTRQARVGMVFQFHYLFEHLTALENVCLAPVHVDRAAIEATRTRGRALLDELGVGHRANAWPRELSGGEAQRVAIARALAMNPAVLLLDEPTASLDPARRESLGTAVGRLAASGRAILLTSHDVEFVREHVTRVVILADGQVVEAGDPKVVLARPSHPATAALLQQRPRSNPLRA